jgi:SCF-associated factor 1
MQLSTKTDIYVWGQQNEVKKLCGYPLEHIFPLPKTEIPGVISDFQIGGWSSNFLNTQGKLFTIGHIDGDRITEDIDGVRPLFFDEHERDIATTTIRSFSVGRRSIIALSDDKTVWLWQNTERPSIKIEFPEFQGNSASKPSRVVSGWQNLSAYFPGFGLIVWASSQGFPRWGVPDPWPEFIKPNYQHVSKSWEHDITSHIILEKLVIYTTATGHVYVSEYADFDPDEEDAIPLMPNSHRLPGLENVTEVQGSFRSFGIFNADGEILIGSQNKVIEWMLLTENQQETEEIEETEAESSIAWNIIPALQKSGVIQLAFGDYHYHALHIDGSITSYGHSPNDCGALGLSALQGTSKGLEGEERLLPHGYITGRRVLFDSTQKDFARRQEASVSQDESRPRRRIWRGFGRRERPATEPPINDNPISNSLTDRGEVGEWMEQQLSDWHLWPEVAAVNESGLAPYFALSVAAGGWSSGALVLVNEEVANKVAEVSKIKLPQNGFSIELPNGDIWNRDCGPVAAWKNPSPAFDFEHTGAYRDLVFGVHGWQSTK